LARSTYSLTKLPYPKGFSMHVYVQNKHGQPLMPTRRLGKVRRWLASGRAIIVHYAPFTICLLDLEGGYTQPLEAGLDLGTAHVGVSVVSLTEEVFAGEFRLRTDLSRRLTDRRLHRRSRRSRKTRYRRPRFLNRQRKHPLPPSMRAKVDETLKVIRLIERSLPIAHWTFEIGNFDPHKLIHPDVEGAGYQHGPQFGFRNVREYVLWRDRHTCQACQGRAKDPILTVHHLERRADAGTDRPDNLITLCETCHAKHHAGTQPLNLTGPASLRDATHYNVLKAYIMRATHPLNRSATWGYITKARRMAQGLPKSHLNDAFIIAGGTTQRRAETHYLGVFVRRQNRKLFKGARSHIRNTVPSAYGFRRWDRVQLPDGRPGFVYGLRSSGYFDVRRLDGTVLSHSIGHQKLRRLESARTLLIERRRGGSSPDNTSGVSAA
jgi:hypothetical protein